MSAKHTPTPGPWFVTRGHQSKLVRGIHAATRNIVNFHGLAAPSSQESQANACLIAAAPELLAAAENALRVFISEGHEHYREVEELRAAIAKAFGSQS